MATTFGFAGAGMASAVAPALKIHNGAIWTLEDNINGNRYCEQEVFVTSPSSTKFGTFSSTKSGGSGQWQFDPPSSLGMLWNPGAPGLLSFYGHFVSTTNPVEYKGHVYDSLDQPYKGKLVDGAVAGC